jgi:hypothetical protein
MSNDGKIVAPLVTDEMRNQLEALRKQFGGPRKRYIAELKVNVSGFIEGTIDLWPSHIRGPIYDELGKLARPYKIRFSYCDQTPEDGFFLHVVATCEVLEQ